MRIIFTLPALIFVLSYSLKYNNILYCIDNETHAEPNWGMYWAKYIKKNTDKKIYITEMWDNWDPTNGAIENVKIQSLDDHPHLHRSTPLNTIDHPELYDFV